MKIEPDILHEGKNLILKRDRDTLIMDVKWGGRISRNQIELIESKGMENVEDETWYGPAEREKEVLGLVKFFDRDWVSREAERLAVQQRMGGR